MNREGRQSEFLIVTVFHIQMWTFGKLIGNFIFIEFVY